MPSNSFATLRSQIEADLRGRVASPFAYRDRNAFELVSTGIAGMDALIGGLPRGAMTEICGVACSGRTSLLLSALASRTADGEVCALVDARDSLDPLPGYRAGAAGHRFADPGWRVWDGGGGFERCADAHRAASATECLVSFSEGGGGYADDFAAAGAGAPCEDVRFVGGAVGS